MTLLDSAIIAAAGIAAGVINVVAGAGTLITFPVLLALGIRPVTGNVSNTVGLVPASISGAYGYRRELRGQWRSVTRMAVLSAVGGPAGGSCAPDPASRELFHSRALSSSARCRPRGDAALGGGTCTLPFDGRGDDRDATLHLRVGVRSLLHRCLRRVFRCSRRGSCFWRSWAFSG